MMKFNNILETIGNTPHVRVNRLFDTSAAIWLKLERSNPGGSIKDRIALSMVNKAEAEGLLKPDSVIVEPTSGNTGIGLAMIGAVRGYRIILVMPESMSEERRAIVKALGAELELTPREKGMSGAIERAKEILQNTKNSWMPSQFDNPANITVHEIFTSKEILMAFPNGLDVLITGVGTGGHITGCAKALKKSLPNILVYAVEPEASPVLSGGAPSPHRIQGIGAGFIPPNFKKEFVDGVIKVSEEEAFNFTRRAAREEGILLGISSGATLAAIDKYLGVNKDTVKDKQILGFCYDTGERYLGVNGLFKGEV
jgi:cysteine synthase